MFNNIKKPEKYSIDQGYINNLILSERNVDQDGDVVSAETWVILWQRTWNALAYINERVAELSEIVDAMVDALNDLDDRLKVIEAWKPIVDKFIEDFYVWKADMEDKWGDISEMYTEITHFYNILHDSTVHYGVKSPEESGEHIDPETGEDYGKYINLWVQPSSNIPWIINDWDDATVANMASSTLIKNGFIQLEGELTDAVSELENKIQAEESERKFEDFKRPTWYDPETRDEMLGVDAITKSVDIYYNTFNTYGDRNNVFAFGFYPDCAYTVELYDGDTRVLYSDLEYAAESAGAGVCLPYIDLYVDEDLDTSPGSKYEMFADVMPGICLVDGGRFNHDLDFTGVGWDFGGGYWLSDNVPTATTANKFKLTLKVTGHFATKECFSTPPETVGAYKEINSLGPRTTSQQLDQAGIIRERRIGSFPFNVAGAEALYNELITKINTLQLQLQPQYFTAEWTRDPAGAYIPLPSINIGRHRSIQLLVTMEIDTAKYNTPDYSTGNVVSCEYTPNMTSNPHLPEYAKLGYFNIPKDISDYIKTTTQPKLFVNFKEDITAYLENEYYYNKQVYVDFSSGTLNNATVYYDTCGKTSNDQPSALNALIFYTMHGDGSIPGYIDSIKVYVKARD